MIKINNNSASNILIGSLLVQRIYWNSNIVWEQQNPVIYTPSEYINSDLNE